MSEWCLTYLLKNTKQCLYQSNLASIMITIITSLLVHVSIIQMQVITMIMWSRLTAVMSFYCTVVCHCHRHANRFSCVAHSLSKHKALVFRCCWWTDDVVWQVNEPHIASLVMAKVYSRSLHDSTTYARCNTFGVFDMLPCTRHYDCNNKCHRDSMYWGIVHLQIITIIKITLIILTVEANQSKNMCRITIK